MTTTWYVVGLLVLLAALVGVAVLIKPDLLRWLSPTQPDEPGDDDREASGADEEFGEELRAMRDAEVSPELVTDTENDLRWGMLWHAFEHDMQAEIDRVFAPILVAVAEFVDFDELRKELMPA